MVGPARAPSASSVTRSEHVLASPPSGDLAAAKRVDDPVAHGHALDDVEDHQGVPVPGDERGVEVPQQGEAVVRRPAQDVRRQHQNQHHHRPAPPPQPLPDLVRLEARRVLEPQLPGDPGVAGGHDAHGAHELQGEDQQEVGPVERPLVHGPDLSAEGLVGAAPGGVRVRHLGRHVGGGDGDEDGHHPDGQEDAARRLGLHARPQRVEDGHRAVVSGPWSAGRGQRAVVSGPWSAGRGQRAVSARCRSAAVDSASEGM
ncbi:hypothetical protein EYF80_061052 [Liparis tanakae]|uniref:Uncharacterized protein n=1 Tax=Liparis tanakae TaxID=230148 RepID=A0A4Z2EJJ2_9TELE|nr:hypothetical protein EYF80_061052 [Liparis tanakae]